MKANYRQNFLAVALIGAFVIGGLASQALAQEVHYDKQALQQRTLERRAVEAAIWGMPIVSFDAMRQAYFRDAKAKYNDIAFLSEPSDWKFLVTTPNNSTRYVYVNFNTKSDGPVVLEIPAAVGAGLFGTIVDAWQVPAMDVGPAGEDQGKGGKYLLLPPGHKGEIPPGYIPVVMNTYNSYALFRAISETTSKEGVAKALALVKQIKAYPLANAANPPEQRYIDIHGTVFDAIVRFDASFYESLARMINEEPVQPHDLSVMNLLRSLGIEKGHEFKPDAATRKVLQAAAQESHQWFMNGLITSGDRFWPNRNWDIPFLTVGPKTGFSFMTDGMLDVDGRGITFFTYCAPATKLGNATFYLGTFSDNEGQRLHGANTYRLRVPPNVPAKQFWAVTVYGVEDAAFFRNVSRNSLDSYDQKAKRNADGSVDIYFGPKAPAGSETNWVPTVAGKDWFPLFRFYGPEKPLFEKTWSLPDFEPVK